MKKLLSLFIALAFLAGITDVALAADSTTVDNSTVSTGTITPTKPAVKNKSKAAKTTKSKKKTSTKPKSKKKKKTSAATKKPAGN